MDRVGYLFHLVGAITNIVVQIMGNKVVVIQKALLLTSCTPYSMHKFHLLVLRLMDTRMKIGRGEDVGVWVT